MGWVGPLIVAAPYNELFGNLGAHRFPSISRDIFLWFFPIHSTLVHPIVRLSCPRGHDTWRHVCCWIFWLPYVIPVGTCRASSASGARFAPLFVSLTCMFHFYSPWDWSYFAVHGCIACTSASSTTDIGFTLFLIKETKFFLIAAGLA